MIFGIDFDGTIVTHDYPELGQPVPLALETLKELQKEGHQLILWTMRSGEYLDVAVEYLEKNGIELFGVNENKEQKSWTSSPKAYCQMYIDDAAVGSPLTFPKNGKRPYVDWKGIRQILHVYGIINKV